MCTATTSSAAAVTNDRGMSLIEVLAALTVMALVVSSVLVQFGQGFLWNQGAALRTQAVNYGQFVIEELKSQPDLMVAGYSGDPVQLSPDFAGPEGISSHMVISVYDQSLNLYKVEIDLCWMVKGQDQHEKLLALLRGTGS